MADIINEIESVMGFVADVITDANFLLQQTPKEPRVNDVTIELVDSGGTSETGASYRLDRLIQIVYFGDSAVDCLVKMSQLDQQMNNAQLIQLKGEARYLRIGSFSFSQPFETGVDGVFAVIGMLRVSVRELRPQPTFDKISNVSFGVDEKQNRP